MACRTCRSLLKGVIVTLRCSALTAATSDSSATNQRPMMNAVGVGQSTRVTPAGSLPVQPGATSAYSWTWDPIVRVLA